MHISLDVARLTCRVPRWLECSLALLWLTTAAAVPAAAQTTVNSFSHTNVTLSSNVSAEMTDGVLSTLGVGGQRTATGGTTGAGFFTSFTEARDDTAPTFPAITRTTVDLRTGQIRGHSTPVPTNSVQFLQTFGRFGEDVTFVNTTGMPMAVPFTWRVNGALTAGNPGSVFHVAIVGLSAKTGVPMPTLRGTTGNSQNLYFQFSEPNVGGVQRFLFYNQLSGALFSFGSSPVWDISPLGTVGAVMASALIVPPGSSAVRIEAYLDVQCRGGYTCDYRDAGGADFAFGSLPAGVSAYSASGAFLGLPMPPPPPSPPSAPTNLQATAIGNTIALNWSLPASGGAPTAYELRARTSPGGPVLVSLPLGNVTTYSVPGAPNGTFILSVVASNALGTSPESSPVTVTTPAPVVPPGPPVGLAATVAAGTVAFNWTPPTTGGATTTFTLLAGTTPGFITPIASVPLPGGFTSFIAPGVPPGTYHVKIVASNAGGSSAPSNEVTIVVAAPQAPSAPSLVASAAGSTVSLSWMPGPTGGVPSSFVLTAHTAGGAFIGTIPLTGTAVAFAGVPAGTYRLTLRGVNAAGTGPESTEVTLVVP